MSSANLDGSTVTHAVVNLPAWGVGHADVNLDVAAEHSRGDRVTLTIADVALSCSVLSGGSSDGTSRYRLALGAGGWGRDVAPKGYADDGAGVLRATIVSDAASEVGETMTGAASTERVGPQWVREDGPASRVMPLRGWYVGLDGLTRIGIRPAAEYAGPAVRVAPTDRALGIVELAAESLAGLEPGVTVDGVEALDVEYELTPKRLTVRCYGSPNGSSKRTEAIRRIVAGLFPAPLRYQGSYEFRVVSQSGERLNLQPVRVSSGMPDLVRVPVRLAPGLKATWAPGSTCLVTFVDAMPSRPVVFAGADPEEPGWMPLFLELGGPGALGVARMTDPVVAGIFGGTIVSGSLRVKASL